MATNGRIDEGVTCLWCQLQGLAARVLGWTPETFWSATPKELAACLRVHAFTPAGSRPLSRSDLDSLKRRLGFDDGQKDRR